MILWVSHRTQIILLRFEGKGQFVLEARPVWHSVHSNVRSHPLCRWVWGEEGNKVCYMSRARNTLNEIWDCAKENSFIPGRCRGGNLDAKDQSKQNLKCSWQINSIKQLIIYLQCLYQLQFPCFGVCLSLYRRVHSLCKWPQDSLNMESENFRNVGVLFLTDTANRPRWFQCNMNKLKLATTSMVRRFSLITGLLNSWCGGFLSLMELKGFSVSSEDLHEPYFE